MSTALPQATSGPPVPALELVRRECGLRLRSLSGEGLATPALAGQLIRPLVSHAAAGVEPEEAVWLAALAVQYAHEASLLHDDVIDQAVRRRGTATVATARGVASALVEGDHLLTTAYRLAARTGSMPFAELFARAVERTVAGERLQGARRGRVLTEAEYREVVGGKSGELVAAAFAAAPLLRGDERWERFYQVGRAVGVCYQLVDDLLDYCPAADTGKAALQDFRQRIWTWPLGYLPAVDWDTEAAAVARALAGGTGERPPLALALDSLHSEMAAVTTRIRELLPADEIVTGLLAGWLERAERGVAATLAAAAPAVFVRVADGAGRESPTTTAHSVGEGSQLPLLPDDATLAAFFARNSRSFSFAARLFPRAERSRVADVYAFCRVTDDLADAGALGPAERAARLDAWLELCRRAWSGASTGVPVLDRVLGEAARCGVPFSYVEDLVAGMRMDLAPRRYQSLADLRVYTARVASVVGLWLTRLWGVRAERVLARAADLGHAMQLTNIVRDVGEDWRAGRLYLPADLLARHRIDDATIASLAAGEPVPARWRALTEELMAVADAYYDRAFAAIPYLPRGVRAPVAAAAVIYQGIHDEVRRNGHDNFTRRARTSALRKLWLTVRAMARLRRELRRGAAATALAPPRADGWHELATLRGGHG